MGRALENDIRLPTDHLLSRAHARFEFENGLWWVRDIGSKNGTLLNSARLTTRRLLSPGDVVQAGSLTITFSKPVEVAPIAPLPAEEGSGPSTVESTSLHSLEERLAKKSQAQFGSGDGLKVQALLEAGRELAMRRSFEELFPRILELAIRTTGAKRGGLMTVENDGLVLRASTEDNVEVSRAVRERVMSSRESLLIHDAAMDAALRESRTIGLQRVRSLMAAPLQTEEKVIGLIYVDTPDLIRPFGPEDLNLLTVLGNIAAIRIEHARLQEVEEAEKIHLRELAQAAEIQMNLLPKGCPQVEGLDVAGRSTPCRGVGGDYFDFLTLPDGKLVIVVADVAGKGMGAALLVSSLHARIRLLVEDCDNISKCITRLNKGLRDGVPLGRFITLFALAMDPATGKLAYCNAGHNPPIIARADGTTERLDQGGPVLGIFPFINYEAYEEELRPGDVLMLYSDGVTEAESPEVVEFGEDRLASFVARHKDLKCIELIDLLERDVLTFTHNAPPADDLTMVALKRLPV